MAQRDLPLSHLDAKRLADIVGLAHGDLTAWREVALVEVGEQERRLALRHLRHARDRRAVARGERRNPRLAGRRLGVARDRVAMGAGRRPAKHLVQALLDHVRDRVLEASRFGVGWHPVEADAVGLDAIAGATISLGRPVARMHGLPKAVQGFLNAFATGILVFLLWDILAHAGGPVEAAIAQGNRGPFAAMALIFAVGIAAGLLGLLYFNRSLFGHLRHGAAPPPPRSLALAIATGLGLHNLSEGLAIGQAAHVGALAFTGVLAVGFALHTITEA